MNIQDMSREELIALVMEQQKRIGYLECDQAFGGILNRNAVASKPICSDHKLVQIDIANMHAANHAFTMDGVDKLICSFVDNFRHTDTVIRWGGDEIVIIPSDDSNMEAFVKRLDYVLHDNNLYAVIAVVTTSEDITETVGRADELVSAVKLSLELNHMKPGRDELYRVLDSHIIYE